MSHQPPKGKKFKNFTRVDLSITEPININFSEYDLIGSLGNLGNFETFHHLFLGRFSEKEMYEKIKAAGMVAHLNSMGFDDLHLVVDKDENSIYYLKIYWQETIPEKQLLDLRVSENFFMPDKKFLPENEEIMPYDMILIEWLSAKNPKGTFTLERPQLPGQSSPGLGILKYCFKLLYDVSSEIFKDGYFDIPNHLHGAIMYSKQFKFFDPVQEALIRGITRDLKEYSLADISWGVITQTIIDLTEDKPVLYEPSEQIHYVSERMKRYFESEKYIAAFKEYYSKKKYRLDYGEMMRRREEILKYRRIEEL